MATLPEVRAELERLRGEIVRLILETQEAGDFLKADRLRNLLDAIDDTLQNLAIEGLSAATANIVEGLSAAAANIGAFRQRSADQAGLAKAAPVDAGRRRHGRRGLIRRTGSAPLSPPAPGVAEGSQSQQPSTPARHIQQQSFLVLDGGARAAGVVLTHPDATWHEVRYGYVVDQPIFLQVFVGPLRQGSIAAARPLPEGELPKDRDHRLKVVFFEPQQLDGPLQAEIVLPPEGDSTRANFLFTPRRVGPFEGRISIFHAGRVLQTTVLRTSVRATRDALTVDDAIRFEEAIYIRQDWSHLEKRRQFDAAVVFNHTERGRPLATGLTRGTAWATSLEDIQVPVRRINELISAVAHSTADYKDGLEAGENPDLLVRLARVGADLYSSLYRDQLRLLATDSFDPGDARIAYLQVISARSDTVVPLEFMYDFNVPTVGAKVCPAHRQALKSGSCPDDCPRHGAAANYVCPMGFWGLRKVIERHAFDPRREMPSGARMVLRAEAIEGRNRLDIRMGSLLGHSQEVKPDEVTKIVNSLGATIAKDWDEWREAILAKRPGLLVAFPHNEGKEEDVRLEIGGTKLSTLGLARDYVSSLDGRAPVVLLLGCDVAGTAQDFSNHIRYFRQAGAAVVVSTIATVFGVHAVRVGEAIVERLLDKTLYQTTTIGEAIRDAKRAALLESNPMGLCVVAFGDADWRL